MLLNIGQVCSYYKNCPYHNGSISGPCSGADANRQKLFYCDLVDSNGQFSESGFRNKHDETGKMQILLENSNLPK